MAQHGKARPCGGTQGPGRDCLAAGAAGNPHVARHGGASHHHGRAYIVTPEGGDAFALVASGREAWALDRLAETGPRGCTPREEHGGAYPGWHGRYVLRATVRRAGA